MKRLSLALSVLLAILAIGCPDALSGEVAKPADYPTKPVYWVSPTAAGAAVDLATRGFTNFLDIGGSVVVENIGGGSQTIGTTEVAHRPADGYAILTMANACGITQPLMNEVGYKISDFRHIAMLAPSVPATIAVRADSPVKSMDDLIKIFNADARYNFGVPNAGGYGHMAIANTILQLGSFEKQNGTMVVYNGSAHTIAAVMNGEVLFAILDSTDAYPKEKNGDLRVIAVLHNTVCPLFPNAELISDHGVKGTETFIGLKWISVRKETPDHIVEWLKQQCNKVIENREYQDLLERTGFGAMRVHSEEEVTNIINTAARDYAAVMKATGIID